MADKETSFENIPLPELDGLTLTEIRQKIAGARLLLKQLQDELPRLHYYTKEDRTAASRKGSLRDGEKEALDAVLEAAAISPGSVEHLSEADQGNDPNKFEPAVCKARMSVAEDLRIFENEVNQVGRKIGDTAIKVSAIAKPVIMKAYDALKKVAETKEAVRVALVIAFDFFKDMVKKKKTGEGTPSE